MISIADRVWTIPNLTHLPLYIYIYLCRFIWIYPIDIVRNDRMRPGETKRLWSYFKQTANK
jgi:hypothetical protein